MRLLALPAAQLTSRRKSRLLVVLLAEQLTSLLRHLLLAVRPRLPLPVARRTSRRRSLQPAVLPAAPATSKLHSLPDHVPGGTCLTGNLDYYSDIPITIETQGDDMKQYFSFQWHITDECDQRCKHCYIFSGDPCRKLDSMTWEQMEDTFYNCLDFCKVYGRLPYFYLTGGDPILHPDFWRLLELFHEHGIPFTILGNPFHLNDQVCHELKYYGCQKYQLSLDGLRETHDWFRKPGSFDCTLEKIGCINRAGIRSVIMTTVSKQNYMEVPGIIDAVVKAGVNIFAFSRYVPSGGELDTSMTPQEYRSLLAMCDKKFKEYEAEGCDTYFNKKDHLWALYEYETGAFKVPAYACDGMIYGGCNCGNCHLTILPAGDIYACRRVTARSATSSKTALRTCGSPAWKPIETTMNSLSAPAVSSNNSAAAALPWRRAIRGIFTATIPSAGPVKRTAY